MVVLTTPRFTLLAALSSIAAVSLVPTSVEAAAIQIQNREQVEQLLAIRHSAHGESASGRKHSESSESELKESVSRDAASRKVAADKPQRHPKPVVPLPARIAQKKAHKASASSETAHGRGGSHSEDEETKHAESKRAAWNPVDSISRMERLWLGARDESGPSSASLLKGRHHHHDHDRDARTKVVVDGDDNHVDVHHRSVPREDHDRIEVEGHNDHVHVHDHGDDDHDRVVVKGDDDHVHVHRRSPSPHHHHDYHHEEVEVKGNHDTVHVHRRSPSPHHHHHDYHHEEVEVKGDHDTVHVHRSPAPHHRHHHHDKVVVDGDHDHVNVHRRSHSPRHHHHHDKVIVKGDNEHVHVGRNPSPHHHHHHHPHDDRVIVKGDDDHVNVHQRRARRYAAASPIVFSGPNGGTFLLHHTSPQAASSQGGLLDMSLHLRRDGQINGVPGSIEIMSQVANSAAGQRIASLVLAAPGNGSTSDNSTSSSFVLNASGSDRTQMYLVTALSAGEASSPGKASSTNTTAPASFIKVALQMPVFDAASAQLAPYCATFDPRPAAPAPMTVEACMDGPSNEEHKSQVFVYEPGTGVIRPMWYDGEDDGTDGDDPDSTAPADDGSGDDQGGTADTSSGTNSTTVDPTTPKSDMVASVTSFEQDALDQQYGDATRPPLARVASAKGFSAEVLSTAQNVTLLFSPAAPEVPQAKVVAPSSATDSQTTASGTPSSGTETSSATSSSGSSTSTATSTSVPETTTATDSSSATDSASTSAVALEAQAGLTSSSGSSSGSTSSTPTSSSLSATDSATATTPPAFEVKVYNPYAESTGTDTSLSSLITSSSVTSSSATGVTRPWLMDRD